MIVSADAPDLDAAAGLATGLSNAVGSVLAVLANAPIGDFHPQFTLASPHDGHRRFAQYFSEPWALSEVTHRLSAEVAGRCVPAFFDDPNFDALGIAVQHYALALRSYETDDTATVSNLFAGMEALKDLAVTQELSRRSMQQRSELATAWSCTTSVLENEARLRLLFQNDSQTHDQAKAVRHPLVHGLSFIGHLQPIAQAAKDKTAHYLRSAILDMASINASMRTILMKDTYVRVPVASQFAGVSGTLPEDFSLESAAALDFGVIDLSKVPTKAVELADGTLNVEMTATCPVRTDSAQVSGTITKRGTNLRSSPRVVSVTRRSGDVEAIYDELEE
jgi:hypothetical protein